MVVCAFISNQHLSPAQRGHQFSIVRGQKESAAAADNKAFGNTCTLRSPL